MLVLYTAGKGSHSSSPGRSAASPPGTAPGREGHVQSGCGWWPSLHQSLPPQEQLGPAPTQIGKSPGDGSTRHFSIPVSLA